MKAATASQGKPFLQNSNLNTWNATVLSPEHKHCQNKSLPATSTTSLPIPTHHGYYNKSWICVSRYTQTIPFHAECEAMIKMNSYHIAVKYSSSSPIHHITLPPTSLPIQQSVTRDEQNKRYALQISTKTSSTIDRMISSHHVLSTSHCLATYKAQSIQHSATASTNYKLNSNSPFPSTSSE